MSRLKAIPSTWKPTADNEYKLLQGAGEISALKLIAAGGAAYVAIYDSKTESGCNSNNFVWALDASTTDVDAQCFTESLSFKKGVSAIIEQGGTTNPVVCIAASKYVV